MEDIVLEARDVIKDYGSVRALDGVNLTVRAGETVVLIGESGSGKSTLLRMFNRLDEPTLGTIWIRGEPAAAQDSIRLRRQTGYVQQEGGLLPHWTVRRNVEMVPWLCGWEPARRRRRGEELLELVGLSPATYRDRYPRELSGGQRQRVALARALAADPGVVLLDEPFGALDSLTRLELQDQYARLQRTLGKTTVLVTHDLAEAFRLGDRIAVLRGGRLLQLAAPVELRANPATPYVRALLARAPEPDG